MPTTTKYTTYSIQILNYNDAVAAPEPRSPRSRGGAQTLAGAQRKKLGEFFFINISVTDKGVLQKGVLTNKKGHQICGSGQRGPSKREF